MSTQELPTDVAGSDIEEPGSEDAAGRSPLAKAAYAVGAVGLLVATGVDAISVLGRHTGFTFLGSIELVQSSTVLTATAAMIIATAVGVHASVHIITQRLSESRRNSLARWANALGALLFAILFVGSLWIASEMWAGFERTELLGIQLRWLRVLWIAGTLIIAIMFVRRTIGGTK
jgi:TRAP-type C4-dicarboxylate transport system permease small subunit